MPARGKCLICRAKAETVDYKDVNMLSHYLDRWSRISPANRNGNCAKHQRLTENAIKKARFLALLPYLNK